MKLTKQHIHSFLNCGCPNRKQLAMLGLTTPLPAGWIERLTERDFTQAEFDQLCALRKQGKLQHVRYPILPGEEPKKLPVSARRPTVEEQLAEALEALKPFALFWKDPKEVPLWNSAFQRAVEIVEREQEKEKLRQKYRDPAAAEADTFANSVYEQSGRDLA